ncbi:MAG: hypothetical protein JXR95_08100 [Deltaproteobacteria bacterium]|nr:hypothetical protein [Deltaproteobacteria bacterium]
MKTRSVFFVNLLTLLCLYGCSVNGNPCLRHSDCAGNEECIAGVCSIPSDSSISDGGNDIDDITDIQDAVDVDDITDTQDAADIDDITDVMDTIDSSDVSDSGNMDVTDSSGDYTDTVDSGIPPVPPANFYLFIRSLGFYTQNSPVEKNQHNYKVR